MPAPVLHVVIASTRPVRVGPAVAAWVHARAVAHGQFSVRLVDLAEVKLPLLDEPEHPRLGRYQHAHTRAWSATVKEADAFVLVMPEYNHGVAPSLLNAIDYLVREWGYTAVGLVSYGGVSGGLRAAQHVKPILTGLRAMVVPEAVPITWVTKQIVDGAFQPLAEQDKGLAAMFDELARWAGALAPLRANQRG